MGTELVWRGPNDHPGRLAFERQQPCEIGSGRFRLVSVSQVRAMDRTAQLRGTYQSACKSHGSTCKCRGTRQDAGCWCSANCTGPAAVYTWSLLEPRPVMRRRRPWQEHRKPTGVISFDVPHPKSRGCHRVRLRQTRRRTTKSLPRAKPKLDGIELPAFGGVIMVVRRNY
jgi:hypothetical protein